MPAAAAAAATIASLHICHRLLVIVVAWSGRRWQLVACYIDDRLLWQHSSSVHSSS